MVLGRKTCLSVSTTKPSFGAPQFGQHLSEDDIVEPQYLHWLVDAIVFSFKCHRKWLAYSLLSIFVSFGKRGSKVNLRSINFPKNAMSGAFTTVIRIVPGPNP
jgi:hypothetical protein